MTDISITTVRGYLTALHKLQGRDRSWQGWLLENGADYAWQPLDRETFEIGEGRECFLNAAHLAIARRDLTYVEGMAMCGFFPVHHAWVVDADGRVIDNTWVAENGVEEDGEGAERQYLGYAVEAEELYERLVEQEVYGVLDGIINDAYRAEKEDAA